MAYDQDKNNIKTKGGKGKLNDIDLLICIINLELANYQRKLKKMNQEIGEFFNKENSQTT